MSKDSPPFGMRDSLTICHVIRLGVHRGGNWNNSKNLKCIYFYIQNINSNSSNKN